MFSKGGSSCGPAGCVVAHSALVTALSASLSHVMFSWAGKSSRDHGVLLSWWPSTHSYDSDVFGMSWWM
jgi:hypothetical protein